MLYICLESFICLDWRLNFGPHTVWKIDTWKDRQTDSQYRIVIYIIKNQTPKKNYSKIVWKKCVRVSDWMRIYLDTITCFCEYTLYMWYEKPQIADRFIRLEIFHHWRVVGLNEKCLLHVGLGLRQKYQCFLNNNGQKMQLSRIYFAIQIELMNEKKTECWSKWVSEWVSECVFSVVYVAVCPHGFSSFAVDVW